MPQTYGNFTQTYTYAEGKGVFVRAVARYIRDGTLNLLPVRSPSYDLLKKAGVIKTGLVGWPQQFIIDIGLPEGFFRQGPNPWAYTFNPSGTGSLSDFKLYDPAASGDLPAVPNIEHAYEQLARYDVARYGMRFAINLYDRVRLGPAMFNKRLKENMDRRINTYALQLNRMIWDNRLTAYHADGSNTSYTTNPSFETLGSIPFFFNGLMCRVGILVSGASRAAADTRPTNLPSGQQIVALTFHDGDFVNTPQPLYLGQQGGQHYSIHWSKSAVFFHPDLIGQTLGNLISTSVSVPASYGLRHVIGTHQRGVQFTTVDNFFNHTGDVTGNSPNNFLSGAYWQVFTPYLLSDNWSLVDTNPSNEIDPLKPNRILAVYKQTKLPAVASVKQSLQIANGFNESYTTYPIYGSVSQSGVTNLQGWYAIAPNGTRIDTRFSVTAQTFEQVYYAMKYNSNGQGPRVLFCRPEIQAALNVYALTNTVLYRELGRGTYSEELKLGAEWDRYKDAVVFVDINVPDGIVYMGTLNDNVLQFAFDDTNFEVFHVPTPNDVEYFHGRFAMKMMMINPHGWGIIWGVKP